MSENNENVVVTLVDENDESFDAELLDSIMYDGHIYNFFIPVEEKEKEEPKKLDEEHESEGMKKAEDACGDTNAGILEDIVKILPELTTEQVGKLKALFESSAPVVEVEPVDVEAAADAAIAKRAEALKAEARAEAVAHMRGIADACRRVRPLAGEMDAMAFDSAEGVYAAALRQAGVDPKKYDKAAYAGMVDMLVREQGAMKSAPAMDSKPLPEDGSFRYLNNISIGE